MHSRKFTFAGAGDVDLAARLDIPEGRVRAWALFAHCFTCTKDTVAASRIARSLTEHGFGVLRFDFTGLGGSEGDFANSSFSSNLEDLRAAVAHMREELEAPAILIGHSLGGTAVLAMAGEVPEAKGVVTIGSPFDPAHIRKHFGEKVEHIEEEGSAELCLGGRPFTIRKEFLDDLEQHSLEEKIAQLKKALLVFHSPLDETVSIDNASRIFLAAKHPKSFVSLDHANHLLNDRADAEYVGHMVAGWAGRYLPPLEEDDSLQAAEGEVVVAENGEGRFANSVAAGRHALRADEPKKVGGDDSGPSPYDYLLTGLGACTSMTIRMYADQKKWPLERVMVRLKHQKIHASDCESCETSSGKIDRIDREIFITGDLDDSQRQRLLEIADKCPVHRTLHSENVITSSLADPAEESREASAAE